MKNLEERIVTALRAYCENKDCLHIPARDTDIDVVLGDALAEIVKQKQRIKKFEDFKKKQIEDFKRQIKSLRASRESLLEYKSGIENPDYVLVPRNLSNQLWEVMWKEFELSESMHEAYKAMIKAVEKDNAQQDS